MGRQLWAGRTHRWAAAPAASPGQPMNRNFRQVLGRPRRHWSHVPHVSAGSMATRWPGANPVTSPPTSSTVPEHSWPSVAGYWSTWLPIRPWV